jgi:hypothetical protein
MALVHKMRRFRRNRCSVTFWLTILSCPPLAGATGPLLPYWDPLGMGQKRPDKFQRWRAVEIKHGRIAMMATLGAQANPSRLSKATTAWLLSQRRC